MKNDYIGEFKIHLSNMQYADKTKQVYCAVVVNFLNHFKKSPEQIFEADLIRYILQFKNCHSKAQQIGALKLFYRYVVKQPLKFKNIAYPRIKQRVPEVLSISEITRLYNSISNLKHKAIFAILYGCGLRVNEVVCLKISDIDSSRMIIRIEKGKGGKDRNVTLSPHLLELLRRYFKQYTVEYLFNGQFCNQYTAKSIQSFLADYAIKAGIKKRVHPHLIRHCYATHLLEAGTDISIIQNLLGHSSPKTTQIYTHVSTRLISNLHSPFDSICV